MTSRTWYTQKLRDFLHVCFQHTCGGGKYGIKPTLCISNNGQ